MVQVKPADADRLLARPDTAVRVVLIYGDDEGLVSERANRFAAAVAGKDGEHLRLDMAALSEDPGRLVDEANSIPMFGGQRAISLRVSGNRSIEDALAALLATPPKDSWVIVIAGELRKSSPLRKLVEESRNAWAVPCYADTARDLDRLIDDETRAAGVAIAPEARELLKTLIGSDRLMSRAEVQKLCLYAIGSPGITADDVRALIGDGGVAALDETVDALASGDAAALDRGYRRLVSSGTPGFVVAGAAQRHFNFLEKARAALDDGQSPDSVVRSAVPPIYPFSRQPAVARQVERWAPARIERALAMLDTAVRDSRLNGNLADEIVGETLHLVATLAPRRG
jgi:DNA polymerase-3 subunit delta